MYAIMMKSSKYFTIVKIYVIKKYSDLENVNWKKLSLFTYLEQKKTLWS